MAQRTVELVNRLGLHARAAAKFVNVSSTFSADIMVRFNDEEVNARVEAMFTTLTERFGAQPRR